MTRHQVSAQSPESLFESYRRGIKVSLLPYLAKTLDDISKDPLARNEAEELLGLLSRAFPGRACVPWALEATLRFNRMILEEEQDFKRRGTYRRRPQDAGQVNQDVYQSRTVMLDYYLPGLFLSYLTWPHHQALLAFYRQEFLAPSAPELVMEWGFGHGLLSVLAARAWPRARLFGLDISPHSLAFTRALMEAETAISRCSFSLGDILTADLPADKACGIICAELLEHVSEPKALLERLAAAMRGDGQAFLTAAINAPQADHIAHFRSAAEVEALVKEAGLTVIKRQELVHPHRNGASLAPTVLALIAAKKGAR
jgi:SAM-dependent methyltransferase